MIKIIRMIDMIEVAFCNVEELDLSSAYELLPKERRDKVDNFMFEKDKKLSAGAYLLLNKLLSEENIVNPVFKKGKYDKPYVSNHENIYFNLSHSGKLVACAISDMEVGMDVEMIDPTIDLNIAKNFFYNSEYENIMKSNDAPDEFFKYWVLKESYMKYTGLGLNLDLDSFEIIIGDEIKLKDDKEDLQFSLFDLGQYKLAIASKYGVEEVKKYDIEDLFK